MAFDSVIRWFLPKDDKFFGLLEEHASVAAEAAAAMVRLPLANGAAREALDEVHRFEHRGDDKVREVKLALEQTFVTPIDREDIHTLSNRLDDIIDYMYYAAQVFVTYDVQQKTPAMVEMMATIAEATAVIRDNLPLLRQSRSDQVATARAQVVTLERRGDDIFRAEMAALYKNAGVDAKELLRQQAVLKALEDALDCCLDAADVMENIAIKHA